MFENELSPRGRVGTIAYTLHRAELGRHLGDGAGEAVAAGVRAKLVGQHSGPARLRLQRRRMWAATSVLVVCAFMGGMGVCRLLDGAGKGGLVITMELAGWLAAAALVVFLGFTRRRLRSIEDMLAESEQRFQLMADAAPAIIWTSVPDGACDYCNHAWFEFLGRHAQGTLGEAWGAAIHPDDFEATRKSYRDAVREHSDYRWEFRLRRHDGEYRWVLSFGAPRTGIDGEHAGYVGMCIDITEEKLQRHRLDEAKTKCRTFLCRQPSRTFENPTRLLSM